VLIDNADYLPMNAKQVFYQSVVRREIGKTERDMIIWLLGDFDPSGVHVYQSLAEDVIPLSMSDTADFRML